MNNMTGRHNLIISDINVEYNIVLDRQVTVLKGNSATGKSTLVRYFTGISKGDSSIHCNMRDKLEVIMEFVANDIFKYRINNTHNKILIVDEDCKMVRTKEFAEIINNSDNYYIIISRDGNLKWLTYSVDSIYELQTDNKDGKFLTKLSKRYKNSDLSLKPDLVITEDSNSGYEMFKSVMDCDVISANGKDNVYNTVVENAHKYNCVYVIVDGSAFGNCIGRIMKDWVTYSNVYIFTPESFEYLLLLAQPFYRLEKDKIDRPYEYCDTKQFISWERYFTHILCELSKNKCKVKYNKSKLDKFFMSDYYKEHIRSMLTDIDFS